MSKQTKKLLEPIAFSYLRFSSAVQGKGDSVDRQTAGADEWSEKNQIEIVQRMSDLGLSAFKGDHVRRGELGAFLDLCKTDDFKRICQTRDVYLLVESLDRLSREKIMTAVNQLSSIIETGVKVVTLIDGQTFDEESMNNPSSLIIAVTVMARSFEEIVSRTKRIRSAWVKMRKRAEAGEIINTMCIPRWMTCVDGKKFVLVPKAVKVVRQVFKLAAEGVPFTTIARRLNAKQVPTLESFRNPSKNPKPWYGGTVKRLILSKSTIGILEFKSKTDAKGDVAEVKGYYPAIIDEKIRAQALKILNTQGSNRGNITKSDNPQNLFRKIAFDKATGEPMYIRVGQTFRYADGIARPIWHGYVPRGVRQGQRKGKTWVGPDFEKHFFSTVRLALEVETSTVKDEADLALCEDKLATVEKRIRKMSIFLADDDDNELDLDLFKQQLKEFQKVQKHHATDREEIRAKILAGAGRVRLNVNETDRARLCEVIRANVERIDMDCDARWFRVQLMNGVTYSVQVNDDGTVEVETNDFKVDALDLKTMADAQAVA